MSTITTIGVDDLPSSSYADINTNFSNLNTDKIETSYLDTDTTLSANSDSKIPTQKAVKAYVDTGGNVNASETTKGIVEEATDAEVTAGTATGGTSAKLFVTPAKLATRLASYQLANVAKGGLATKNLNDASATVQNIAHGLGRTPLYVKFSVTVPRDSVAFTLMGYANPTTNVAVWNCSDVATSLTFGTSDTWAIGITDNTMASPASDGQTGVVTMDATNIIITWTKNGSTGDGVSTFMWEALA